MSDPAPTPSFASDAPSAARSALVFAVALAPILAIWAYVTWIEPRPFWAYFFDPEGIYFFEGLRLFSAQAPLNVDNPGTPVQMLSAFAVFFTDHSPLAFDTVRHIGYGLTLLFTALALWRFQRIALHGLPVFAAVTCCWLYFAGPQALQRFHVWSPEALFPAAGLFALAALWRALEEPERPARPFVAGLAVGVCCAVKFTFLGWVPAVVAAIAVATRGGPERIRGVLVTVGGVITGFVLGTLPAIPRYGHMFGRLFEVSGIEGRAPTGPAGILHMMGSSRGWHFALALLVVGTAIELVRARRARGGLDPVTRGAVTFAAIAIVAGYAMTSGAPNLRYLLPTTLATTLLLTVYFRTAADTWVPRWLVPTFVVVLFARAAVVGVPGHHELVRDSHLDRDAVTAAIERLAPAGEPPVVVYGGRAPHPALALLMFAQTPRQREAIGAAYPLAGMYRTRRRTILLPGTDRPWDLLVLEADELEQFPEPTGDVLAVIASQREGAPDLYIAGRPRQ